MIHQAGGNDLAAVVGDLDQLRALAEAGLIVAAAEAEQRGVIEQSQCASTAAWVRDAAWHLQTGGSAAVAKCVAILRRHDLGGLPDAVRSTDVTPSVAVTVAAEFDKLAARLPVAAHEKVLDLMIDIGAEHGCSAVKQLHQEILARWGEDGEFQGEQDSRKRYVDLSPGRDDGGIYRYELTVDAEGRAVLEAAIGPLSKPQPEPDGTVDLRPVGRRRGEALIEVCRRAVAAGDRPSTNSKAAVYVTMTLDELRNAMGAGTVVGSLDNGSLLGPETVRRIACDAAIIPVVLGSDSEILDVGRTQRLFTGGQLKRCGYGTGTAPSPAAKYRPTGPTPTTSSTGSTVATRIWPTEPCSAAGTIRSCTATNWLGPSSTDRSSGTEDPAPTNDNHPLRHDRPCR